MKDYIKNVCGIHKSFEFLERLCDSFTYSSILQILRLFTGVKTGRC